MPSKEAPSTPPPTAKYAPAKGDVRDESKLKKVEVNEPLELILLDQNQTDATVRVKIGITVEVKEALQ